MLVRSREVSLQSQIKELGRARTTTGIHVEMQRERPDAHIQKKRKEKKIILTDASSTTIQSGPLPSPCAMLSIPVSPPHSISEQKGRWQLTPATGDQGGEEKARRERRGKQGDFTVSSVKIN